MYKQNGKLKDYHVLMNEDIGKKLYSLKELSGVLNWALKGFERLNIQKGFTYTKSLEETKKEMIRYSSRTMEFLYDCVKETNTPEQYETLRFLYSKFKLYCKSKKDNNRRIKPETEREFKRIIEQEMLVESKRSGTVIEFKVIYAKYTGDY